jgi:glycosyltransferase EpsD
MAKKIIFISNHTIFSKFNIPFMKWFKEQGWQVDYASNGEENIPFSDNKYIIDIKRIPFKTGNIKAYFQLKKIFKNNYDIVHCHTPMGGVLGRFTIKNGHYKANVIYTAHGLHFYKGAPLINWLFYYPVEKYLAGFTDALILLNKEDYEISQKKYQGCKNVYKIDGVGVDLKLFFPLDDDGKRKLRAENGYEENFIIVYAAEFITRKNHLYLLKQTRELIKKFPELRIFLLGNGVLEKKISKSAKILKMSDNISFFGYRSDVNKIYQMADIIVSPSLQEGLPINIIEGLATGLPIVCSKIRGHTDLIENGRNGFLFDLNNPDEMRTAIKKLHDDKDLRKQISMNNIIDAKKYSLEIAIDKMAEIYRQFM